MWAIYPCSRVPNISAYPEVMFAGKVDEEMEKALMGLSNRTNKMVLEQLVDVKIKVGEQIYNGMPRVVISFKCWTTASRCRIFLAVKL